MKADVPKQKPQNPVATALSGVSFLGLGLAYWAVGIFVVADGSTVLVTVSGAAGMVVVGVGIALIIGAWKDGRDA